MSEVTPFIYDVALVNNLLDAGAAVDTFNNNNGEETVYEKLKEIIVKNNAASRIGISLVHKPITSKGDAKAALLTDEFRLVRFGNIVFPIEISKLAPIEGYLLPSKFAFAKDGSINVVELAYTPDIAKYTLTKEDFATLKEIKAALDGSPLAKVIGVHLVGLYTAGITSAHKNAVSTFPVDEVESLVEADASRIESDWEFLSGEAQVVGLLVTSGGGGQNFQQGGYTSCSQWGPGGNNNNHQGKFNGSNSNSYGNGANVGNGGNNNSHGNGGSVGSGGNGGNSYYIYGAGVRPGKC